MEGTTTVTGMEWVTTAIDTLIDLVGTILTKATEQPLFAVILAGGTLLPLGFRIFKKFKRI